MAFGSGHSFGALGDDDLLDAPAGADEALDRAADLVRLVDAIHAARGTAAAESSHAQLLHALAAITDASIIRTARVDVSFPSESGEVVKSMPPMLLAAWRGEIAAVKAMVERAAELAKREPKHLARSLKNMLSNECARTPAADVRPSDAVIAEVSRVLASDFGSSATRLAASVSSVPDAASAELGREASTSDKSAAPTKAGDVLGGGSSASDTPRFPAPVARTDTERLILARVDQICEAAARSSSTGLEKIVSSLDRVMLKRLINRRGSKGDSPLSTAIGAGSYDCAEVLLEHGAQADMRPQNCEDVPVLAMAITTPGIDNVRTTTLLLSYNADPSVETHEGQTMMELARVRGNRPIRYWLTVAQTLPPVPPLSLGLEAKVGLARLRALEFSLVGQMPAKRQVVAAISAFFRLYDAKRRGGRPVVMLLPGPPGHGKTMLAKAIARVIQPLAKRSGGELPFATLNCSVDKSSANIFGGDIHTVGKGGGKLTRICGKFHANPAVIVIDEIDKCSPDALKGFYRVFDDGILDNTGGAKDLPEIDCSKHIFVLTCNWAQKLIQTRDVDLRDSLDDLFDEEADEAARRDAVNRMGVLLERLSDEVKDTIRSTLSNMRSPFGGASAGADALVGRMQTIVPFISLTPDEVTVITALFLESLKAFMRKPPIPPALGPGKYHGNMRLLFEDAVIDFVAKRYRQADGVRSIEQEIRNLETMLASAARLGSISNGDDVVFALRQVYIAEKLFDYVAVFRRGDEPSLFDVLAADEAAPASGAGAAAAASAAGASAAGARARPRMGAPEVADEAAMLREALGADEGDDGDDDHAEA
ncbi:hypothetical protein FNF31_06313 [Cafeteria roenbergensis]|uniref:AAA+ ATPase domain-containing protein n=1 Tax=Cafeteria roenbergensis TaxID=33653 RepID=A0A5A8DU11_CAFRO|nr:hypothetical protein FNF31_06313 [Cafeteria roenbergensis]KAA0168679.1 hypothetical protein FNF28_02418 [Cafeteria roenbergensis]